MKVSIIISNRNDVSMLVVTVRSCIEELRPLGLKNCEIVICDNSDAGIYKLLGSAIPTGYVRDRLIKVFRQDFPCLFSARETAIENAIGDYILCIDSHCIIGRDMVLDLVGFMDSMNKDETLGFAHAPINWAHQHERASKHDRDMSTNELGDWGGLRSTPQTITWKGMPWICRRKWFLDKESGIGGYGSLAEHKVSWGGGDMFIGLKPWLLGFKNWAVPCSSAIHIGPFPKLDQGKDRNSTKIGIPGQEKYRLYSNSGNGPHAIGFLIACFVLGGVPMMQRNKAAITNRFGKFINVEKEWDRAIELGKSEREWLLSKQKISFEELLKTNPWNSND